MKYLLDTDTCVFWLRGRTSVREQLAAAGVETIGVAVLTVAELRYGAACSQNPAANHQSLDDFISGLQVVDFALETARLFGDLKAQLRAQGQLLEDFDLLIAATALTHGLTLVTNNMAHFQRVPNLTLANWVLPPVPFAK